MGAVAYSNKLDTSAMMTRSPEEALAGVLTLATDSRCFAERLREYVRNTGSGLRDDIQQMLERHYVAFKPMATPVGRAEFNFFSRGVRNNLFKGANVALGKQEAQVMFVGTMILMLPEGSNDWLVYAKAWNQMRGVPRNYHIKLD